MIEPMHCSLQQRIRLYILCLLWSSGHQTWTFAVCSEAVWTCRK